MSEQAFAEELLENRFAYTSVHQEEVDDGVTPVWANWRVEWKETVDDKPLLRWVNFAEHSQARRFAGLMIETNNAAAVEVLPYLRQDKKGART